MKKKAKLKLDAELTKISIRYQTPGEIVADKEFDNPSQEGNKKIRKKGGARE